MCGFFVTNKKLNAAELDVIFSRIQTRGPDDVKIRIGELGSYVFSRLACTGRKFSSMQPLHLTEYSYDDFFVFNGEIYNYKELNKKFKLKLRNKNLSDTEVIHRMIKKFGFVDALKKFNGAFAIGYTKKNFENCILTKDIYGQKSLYFSFNKKNWFYGNDPYSVAYCSNRSISEENLKKYLGSNEEFGTRGLLNPNLSFFKNVFAVKAGDIIFLNNKGFKFLKENISTTFVKNNKKQSLKNSINHFNKLLDRKIKEHIDNNNDVCFEFSGGIDSTLLMISNFKNRRDHPYYIKIAEGIDNIAQKSINKLKKLKLNYKIVNVTKNEYLNDTLDFIRYTGLPPRWGTAPSMMPLYKQMMKDKMKICLGGVGADEIFYGYPNYTKILNFDFEKLKKLNSIELVKKFSFSGWRSDFSKDLKVYIALIKKLTKKYIIENPNYKKNAYTICDLIRYIDLNVFMTEISDPQADLTAIMTSIELRSPFLDKEIVNYATKKIDHRFIINENSKKVSKFFLKKCLEQRCIELKLDPKIFVEKEKEGTRNFAIQFFKKLSIKSIPKKILNDLRIKDKNISPKMKFKIFFVVIFYMIFKLKLSNEEISKLILKNAK
tara:strand:+ start:15549 stop:17360 length:1812 start_codon:yes stop_codon:yes gene_type:complete